MHAHKASFRVSSCTISINVSWFVRLYIEIIHEHWNPKAAAVAVFSEGDGKLVHCLPLLQLC